jgi:hypothetical protein
MTTQQLFFSHCKAVLNYIKVKYPSITAIMWDDMLRYTELPVLLGKLHDAQTYLFCWVSYTIHRLTCSVG